MNLQTEYVEEHATNAGTLDLLEVETSERMRLERELNEIRVSSIHFFISFFKNAFYLCIKNYFKCLWGAKQNVFVFVSLFFFLNYKSSCFLIIFFCFFLLENKVALRSTGFF